jgi:twitching motility protein PilT
LAIVEGTDVAEIDRFLRFVGKQGGSDLHLSSGTRPQVRLHGLMTPINMNPLTAEEAAHLLDEVIPERNKKEFAELMDTDFAYELSDVGRFRVNIFMDRFGMGGVFRLIPHTLLTPEALGLPDAARRFCELPKGLILVTGPTGSGKSTTLATMLDMINKARKDHIITIEDPIEFVHTNQKCLVNQREVKSHTGSFAAALRAALREDPDIVLVGEMRDLETTHIAIETAETGHLVLATLHTTTAASTVDRIIDQFPADRQQQIRTMLSTSLKGVIAQTLLRRKAGGRVAAYEVLVVTSAIANLIREGRTFQIPSIMQTARKEGMMMLNDAALKLVMEGTVDAEEAMDKVVDKKDFLDKLKVAGLRAEETAE